MAEATKESHFKGVDLHPEFNNSMHHTSEISLEELIVRRGQPFKLTLELKQRCDLNIHPLAISVHTGESPTEEQGTQSLFSLPDIIKQNPLAKAVWKVELHKDASLLRGLLVLTVTPPADTPIGKFNMVVKYRNEDKPLPMLVVLYNPWCSDDWVYMTDEKEIDEYVMNEEGIIYKGSASHIFPCNWDFGQFEDKMVDICVKILDLNIKHGIDPGDDVSARCNPIYVGRVISAMINSQDDGGIVVGCWDGRYNLGYKPSHWTGSHAILKRWFDNYSRPVKYGQCWVFAGVMCSVMRLLGIPCRVVTNFESAHDNNKNLIIDVFHADYGVREQPSHDSIWNFHVWTEAWMRRPDLAEDGRYDGWQVLDPTPQEKSEGVYCCGPAPVKAILEGQTDLKYDIPFVFAEVNADCIDWLVKADRSKVNIFSDTSRVGQNISTKSVGSNKRLNITDSYKYREGSEKERSIFKYALTRVSGDVTKEDEDYVPEENGIPISSPKLTPPPPVAPPTDGKDVRLNLVLHCESTTARQVSINISVKAMRYNGQLAVNIQNEVQEKMLQPGIDLSIPIQVLFSDYHIPMVECDSMKVSALVTCKENPDCSYLAEDDVVLLDPPMTIEIPKETSLYRQVTGELNFMNPVNDTLKQCTLTLSGSGLFRDEVQYNLPNLKKGNRVRVQFSFIPYKSGKKTLMADFDCSSFRDIKCSSTILVKPRLY
ncbi:protein-glutamine gamma-glutamyltransferase E-like [Anoplopoma fimbria]|uniref:protein-glutamine gamma-glutamyltransferase E-like n=1 Tax=Anoplopoma fimbria TaxID=229290 RepID=UPI0023ECF2CF|nr:protein-glutamine gamma-glutamyltransferase E-like [Anoplopoma fimbria]